MREAVSGSAAVVAAAKIRKAARAGRRPEDLQRQATSLARLRHDEQRVRTLEEGAEIDSRTAAYIEAGTNAALARANAEAEVRLEREAMNAEAQRSAALGQLQDDIDLARIQNNIALADVLSDQYEIQRRTRDLVSQRGIDEAEAANVARRYVEIRREALNIDREHALDRRNLEVELEAARLRGDTRAEAAIRRRLDLEAAITELRSRGVDEGAAVSRAEAELATLERADMQGKFRQWFTGGVTAALEGDLDDFFENWIRDRAAAGLENALNEVADIIFDSFSGALSNVISGGENGLADGNAAMFAGTASAGIDKLGVDATKAGDALSAVLAAAAADAGSKLALSGAAAALSAAKETASTATKSAAALSVTTSSIILAKSLLAAAAAAQAFAASGGGGDKGGIIGAVTSVLGTVLKFGGGKATGGPVGVGQYYTVGERGPETFVPNVPGFIVPNGGFGGGAPVVSYVDRTAITITGASTQEVAQLRAIVADQIRSKRQDTIAIIREAARRPRGLGG